MRGMSSIKNITDITMIFKNVIKINSYLKIIGNITITLLKNIKELNVYFKIKKNKNDI